MVSKNTFSSAFKKKKGFLPEKRVWFRLAESEKREGPVCVLAGTRPTPENSCQEHSLGESSVFPV